MTRFNINGVGFLDLDEGQAIGFKMENQHFRFAEISLGRSVQFTIPATDRNCTLLGFGNEPYDYGAKLRRNLDCQMVYDGGKVDGMLQITDYEGDTFKCVFYIGASSWIDRLKKMSMKDVPNMTGSVVWAQATPVADADTVDPYDGMVQLIKYDNNINNFTGWQLVPSVHLKTLFSQVCTNIGAPNYWNAISDKLWLVAGQLGGGVEDTVTFTATNNTDGSVTQTQNYFDTYDGNLNYKWSGHIRQHTPCRFFKALVDVDLTFPSNFPQTVYAPHFSRSLDYLGYVGDYQPAENWNVMGQTTGYKMMGDPLGGRTVTIKKGTIFFFTDIKPSVILEGYYKTCAPFAYQCKATRQSSLSLGETWKIENNLPDMTVFEFLRSVALATGMELTIDAETGVTIGTGSFAQAGDFKALERVTSVDSVSRIVSMWGDSKKNIIAFDDDSYVDNHITSPYVVDNEHREGDTERLCKFSAGDISSNGILIADVDASNKFTAKKWTIARATPDSAYLQRIEEPQPEGYNDIATNSTCVKVKVVADEADLFALKPSTTFLWRGMAYIWTDATLSGGVMSLTLQKVSQGDVAAVPEYPNALTLTAETAGATVTLSAMGANAATLDAVLDYSVDGGTTWQTYTFGDTITLTNIGDSVKFKGNNARFSKAADAYYNFALTGDVAASGDVTSLIDENGGDIALTDHCFAKLFLGCTSLTTAPSFPSMDIYNFCYWQTFKGCASLVAAPELPSVSLSPNCYVSMFEGCSSLVAAPELGATTLMSTCYGAMFKGCSSLVSAPVLYADVLAQACYLEMFRGCNLLNEVEMHATDISATNCLTNWLNGVAAVGALRCDPSLTLPSGASGIPTGWKRQTIEGNGFETDIEADGYEEIMDEVDDWLFMNDFDEKGRKELAKKVADEF